MSRKTEAIRIVRMLEIIRISDHEWRIADRRADENSGTRVIGFLQETDGRFESTKLGACPSTHLFDTFDRALRCFVQHDDVLPVSENPSFSSPRHIASDVEV